MNQPFSDPLFALSEEALEKYWANKNKKEELTAAIQTAVDLRKVVADYFPLEDSVDTFSEATCPFHNESQPPFKPSFVVSAENKFYCYGCHRGGDVIDFISSMEKLSRADAIKFIGEKYI